LKRTLILDAGVLTLHFAGDSRVKEYFDEINDEKAIGLVAGVNLAEYYHKTCQKQGKQTADSRYFMVQGSKVRIVNDGVLTRLAGLEKCTQHLDISSAGAFALALAKRERGILLTTDSELRKLTDVQVKFLKVQPGTYELGKGRI
jgi:predicted nucleic acid-binding protein